MTVISRTVLSFHSQVAATQPAIRQQQQIAPGDIQQSAAELEQTYYVTFVTSEGDSMKGPLTSFFDAWEDDDRGDVPINWGVHPVMSRFPAMLEHYYAGATENDYFVGMQPFMFDMDDPEGFGEVVRADMAGSDLRVLSGSFGPPNDVPDKKQAFFNEVQTLGAVDLVFEGEISREGYLEFYPDGTPVVGTGSNMTYWHRVLGGWDADWKAMYQDPATKQQVIDALVAEIEYIASKHPGPYNIVVYSDIHDAPFTPTFFAEVADALGEQFKVARMDEAMAGLRKWKQTAPLVDGFELGAANHWEPTDWDERISTDEAHTGSHAMRAGPDDTELVSKDIDTRGYESLTVSFWYRSDGIDDDDDVFFQLFDGSSYVDYFELGNSADGIWHEFSALIENEGDDAVFFREDMKLRFEASGLDGGFLGWFPEYLWIDNVRVVGTPVPEPGTLLLGALALVSVVGVTGSRRRRVGP